MNGRRNMCRNLTKVYRIKKDTQKIIREYENLSVVFCKIGIIEL